MVKLMLHHAGKVSLDPFVMLRHILVKVGDMNACVASHRLMNTRNTEASFFHGFLLGVFVDFHNMRIDEHMTEAGILGQIFFEHIEVDDHQTDSHAYLRSRKTNALCSIEGLIHIGDDFRQIGVIGGDILGHLSQYRLAIYINR